MSPSGKLFVISGPSGSGKGTLVGHLFQHVSRLWFSISATTRKPRACEIDGRDYFFITKKKFEELIRNDGFLEYAQFAGNYYGTPRKAVLDKMNEGYNVILEIDCQGARQVKERFPDAISIFIMPPSLEVLEKRLRKRSTETEDEIKRRLSMARLELKQKMQYDMCLVNDDYNVACKELQEYIQMKIDS